MERNDNAAFSTKEVFSRIILSNQVKADQAHREVLPFKLPTIKEALGDLTLPKVGINEEEKECFMRVLHSRNANNQ